MIERHLPNRETRRAAIVQDSRARCNYRLTQLSHELTRVLPDAAEYRTLREKIDRELATKVVLERMAERDAS
jgi:hypothetical protein